MIKVIFCVVVGSCWHVATVCWAGLGWAAHSSFPSERAVLLVRLLLTVSLLLFFIWKSRPTRTTITYRISAPLSPLNLKSQTLGSKRSAAVQISFTSYRPLDAVISLSLSLSLSIPLLYLCLFSSPLSVTPLLSSRLFTPLFLQYLLLCTFLSFPFLSIPFHPTPSLSLPPLV